MKKAQVETMGLVIIVVLLIMIALFFLIFSGRNKIDSTQELFLTMKANNLANSLRYVNVGSSNFEQKVIDCCAGLDGLACTNVEETAESGMALIDENTGFSVKCFNEESYTYGDCTIGVNSVSITVSSSDVYYVTICRK
nr:hypothetical protein [Nanoarchaeum sp.]